MLALRARDTRLSTGHAENFELDHSRYFYLADPAEDLDAGSKYSKEAAELWAFTAAALPRIEKCNAAIADSIESNADIFGVDDTVMSSGHEALRKELENVYSCLGFTCKDVGAYLDESGEVVPGMENCTTMIAGYNPYSVVVQHSKLDLDMAELETSADAYDFGEFGNAFKIYSEGSNR